MRAMHLYMQGRRSGRLRALLVDLLGDARPQLVGSLAACERARGNRTDVAPADLGPAPMDMLVDHRQGDRPRLSRRVIVVDRQDSGPQAAVVVRAKAQRQPQVE